jgi:hypothetical protein
VDAVAKGKIRCFLTEFSCRLAQAQVLVDIFKNKTPLRFVLIHIST